MKTNDFWQKYDSYCHSLKNSDIRNVSIELEKAKTLVNGLTDGWHLFLTRLISIKNSYKDSLSHSDGETLEKLIRSIEQNLKS